MKESIKNHILVGGTLLIFACALVVGVWFVHYNQANLEDALKTILSEKNKTLIDLADITDRNGADETITRIVSDCARRGEYESLLVKLSSLNMRDLLALQNLTDACGSFYAERKALMVSKLELEYVHYRETADLLSLLTTHEATEYHTEEWSELVELEKVRSSLLTEQESIQEKIVSVLIQGLSVQSTEVVKLVQDAQEISDLLGVHNSRIDEKREFLKSEYAQ